MKTHSNKYETIMERSVPGRRCTVLNAQYAQPSEHIPDAFLRGNPPELPEVAELDLVRHYTNLSRRNAGIDNAIYPLGSCTMKYNPKRNDKYPQLFANIHPLANDGDTQGCLELLHNCDKLLCEITGMDAFTFQPMAGAHGEWTGLLIIRAHLQHIGQGARDTVLVPDSAHGTNPASAAGAGFKVAEIPSTAEGYVDMDAYKRLLGPNIAAVMLTNPSTLGIFEPNIVEISRLAHEAGVMMYYDGANLNAILGRARPGDMGFDVVHLNLHKTFSTPHGCGGPGSGVVGVTENLQAYLPAPVIQKKQDEYYMDYDRELSIGRVSSFHGNFGVIARAYAYILSYGAQHLPDISKSAVLNANYLRSKLTPELTVGDAPTLHEFVASCSRLKEKYGITANDIAKLMIDSGVHPPTVYFPLIIPEAMMFEPTETESIESLDKLIDIINSAVEQAIENPSAAHEAPVTTAVGRLDEVAAARKPIIKG